MKRIVFILAFTLMTGYTFGNNTANDALSPKKELNTNFTGEVIKIIVNNDFTCTEYHAVYYDGELVAEFEVELPNGSAGCNGIVHHYLKSDPNFIE